MDRQIPTGQDKVAANMTIVWFRHEKHKQESDKDRNKNRERYRGLIRGKKGTGGKRGDEVVRRRQGTAGGKRGRKGNLITTSRGRQGEGKGQKQDTT